MQETVNALIKEQFGTGPVSQKLWYVMTEDSRNLAKVPVENGRFHLAIMLEGIYGETKVEALMTFRRCFHKRHYSVVESVEEAKGIMPNAPIVTSKGEMIQLGYLARK